MASAPELIDEQLKPAVEAGLLGLIPDLADYPPQPAGSKYVRTGTLGREWTSAEPEFKAVGSGFEGRVGNNTPYGPYVQGEEQAPQNEHWQKADEVAEQHRPDIEKRLEQAVERVTRRLEEST